MCIRDRSFLCVKCRTLQCSICESWKTQENFPKEQLNNSSRPDRRLRCFDCCNPQCAAPSCKTCKVCRSTGCKSKTCKKSIAALNPKQMPNSLDEVKAFFCNSCRFVTCVTEGGDGRICGKVAPKKNHADLRAKKKPYTCGECLTAEKSKKSLASATTRR